MRCLIVREKWPRERKGGGTADVKKRPSGFPAAEWPGLLPSEMLCSLNLLAHKNCLYAGGLWQCAEEGRAPEHGLVFIFA